jgi:hypothetical protein
MSVATARLSGKVISKSIKDDKVFSIVEVPDPKWKGQFQAVTIPGDLALGQVVDITAEWNER